MEKLVRMWPWSGNNRSLWRTRPCLETPTLPSTCTLLPNRDHHYHAMESLSWSPAKDHVTSSWAWSCLIPTSSKALLSLITLRCFTLSPGSHRSSRVIPVCAHLLLAWYLHEHTGHWKALVNLPLWEEENENFLEGAHVGAGHFVGRQLLAMTVWLPPSPPQKPSLLLLEHSPDCIHEKNNFLQLGREIFCPKTFTVSGGHLWEGQQLLLPLKSTPSYQKQISCYKVQFMEFM